jgi:DNA-binding LytR/AlgR family response regulator
LKISISEDTRITETEIAITCNHLTPEIEKIISMLRMIDMKLTGMKDGETCLIDAAKVLYMESVDKKTFIYTESAVYESSLKLYELEAQLERSGFFRASKSCIIHLKQIKSLRADLNRRIKVTMLNGEQLIVSRGYAEELKERLGVK